MLRHPDVIDHLGDGCLLEFLREAGSQSAIMACGKCALNGFNDGDGITNTESGSCGNFDTASDEMIAGGAGLLEEVAS